jgi:hypothetical protein
MVLFNTFFSDKTKSFGVVEELNCSFTHNYSTLKINLSRKDRSKYLIFNFLFDLFNKTTREAYSPAPFLWLNKPFFVGQGLACTRAIHHWYLRKRLMTCELGVARMSLEV